MCPLVFELQAELARFGSDDGRAGIGKGFRLFWTWKSGMESRGVRPCRNSVDPFVPNPSELEYRCASIRRASVKHTVRINGLRTIRLLVNQQHGVAQTQVLDGRNSLRTRWTFKDRSTIAGMINAVI